MNSSAPFYNRHPWNRWVGMVLITSIVVLIAGATTPWILLIPCLIWFYRNTRQDFTRTGCLQQCGYFSGSKYLKYWIYEERRGYKDVALLLPLENTEPGHWELYIPNDDLWRQTVPSWAADRRPEIASRIAEGWKAKDIHIPADAADAQQSQFDQSRI